MGASSLVKLGMSPEIADRILFLMEWIYESRTLNGIKAEGREYSMNVCFKAVRRWGFAHSWGSLGQQALDNVIKSVVCRFMLR